MGKPSDVVEFVGLLISELGVDGPIAEDTPLITSGVIDSFDVVTLLAIIESQYRVTLTPEELDQETFDTPAQMLAHIQAAK